MRFNPGTLGSELELRLKDFTINFFDDSIIYHITPYTADDIFERASKNQLELDNQNKGGRKSPSRNSQRNSIPKIAKGTSRGYLCQRNY